MKATNKINIGIVPDFSDISSGKSRKEISSGIGIYCYYFIEHLNKIKTKYHFTIFVSKEDAKILPALNNNFTIVKSKYSMNISWITMLWYFFALPLHIKRHKINLLHLLSGNKYLPFKVKCPTIATVQDLRKFKIKNLYGYTNDIYFKHILSRLISKTDYILAISQSTADDLKNLLRINESRIKIIYMAHNELMTKDISKIFINKIKSKYGLNKSFILYVSRLEHPGKNHINLIKAYSNLIKSKKISHDLILVGKNWNGAKKIFKVAKKSKIANHLKFLGFVPENDLSVIYTLADIFIFPSLAEGFGIPLLEAMASKTPILCSNINVFKEVADKAALYFDPTNIKEISNTLLKLVNNHELQKTLMIQGEKQVKKYSWTKNAKTTLLQYKKILSKHTY